MELLPDSIIISLWDHCWFHTTGRNSHGRRSVKVAGHIRLAIKGINVVLITFFDIHFKTMSTIIGSFVGLL